MGKDKIPKVIHYCWFGSSELGEKAKKCIESWHHYFPDYEIKRWDENNFNIHDCPYVQEAYVSKKWAFVSDYARIWILYHEGGIYFDTDVEVIKDMTDIIEYGPYLGIERYIPHVGIGVNPGLGMAAFPKDELLGEMLNEYKSSSFLEESQNLNDNTIVIKISKLLRKYGLKDKNAIQNVKGYRIYPIEYFNPLNDEIGKLVTTENTYSIHWYSATWLGERDILYKKNRYRYCSMFGNFVGIWIAKIITAYQEGGFVLLLRKAKKLIS